MKKLKVFVQPLPITLSRGIHRVANALKRYAPDSVEIVDHLDDADLITLHVIGMGSMKQFDRWIEAGKQVAMIQYCFQTTEQPTAKAWWPYWNHSRVVMSYYDLAAFAFHEMAESIPCFVHTPLGVDGDVFRPSHPLRKCYLIGTSGTIAETEGTTECNAVAHELKRAQLHIGPRLDLKGAVSFISGIDDVTLAELWSRCTYVAALRRVEGFELPGLEALACGSRPVCFNKPHYTKWFGDHAEYIEEADTESVIASLNELFQRTVRVVTPQERDHVVKEFHWSRMACNFWREVA